MAERKYRDKKWNSLTDFKQFLERTKFEKIIAFNGMYLKTSHGRYGLYDSKLFFKKSEKK